MTLAKGGPRSRFALLLVLVACALGIQAASRRLILYEVAGESMLPALRPGDWLLADRRAVAHRAPRPGGIVLATDPREPSRTIVKRVTRIDLHGLAWLEGDNPSASTDSRHFGPVSSAGLRGRVLLRYWPRPSLVR